MLSVDLRRIAIAMGVPRARRVILLQRRASVRWHNLAST